MSEVFPKCEEWFKNRLKSQGFSDIIHYVRKATDLPKCAEQRGEEKRRQVICR